MKSWRTAATGQDHQAASSWDDFKKVKDRFSDVKFMLKGIGTGEDADIACQHGVWVLLLQPSRGRQLDHGRGSAAVLPEVIDAVKGRAKIAVDGSFSRGSDIVEGDLPGRRLGRPGPALYCYGLAAAQIAFTMSLPRLNEPSTAILASLRRSLPAAPPPSRGRGRLRRQSRK